MPSNSTNTSTLTARPTLTPTPTLTHCLQTYLHPYKHKPSQYRLHGKGNFRTTSGGVDIAERLWNVITLNPLPVNELRQV